MLLTQIEYEMLYSIEHRKTFLAGAASNQILEYLIEIGLIYSDLSETTSSGKDFLTMATNKGNGYYGW